MNENNSLHAKYSMRFSGVKCQHWPKRKDSPETQERAVQFHEGFNRWQIFCYMFLVLLVINVVARPLQAQQALGLQALINMALNRNPDVISQKVQVHIARLQRGRSLSRLLPNLDAEGGYIYSSTQNGIPDFVAANGQREALAFLTLHQSLFNAGNWGQYRQNGIEEKKEGVLFRQVRQDVILQVIANYFELLKLRGEVRVLKENLNSFNLMAKQSRLLFESGSVPEIDVKKSRVEYLLQQNSFRQSQKAYVAASNRLKILVGLPLSDSLTVKEFPPRKVTLKALPRYEKAALENSPEWRALKLEEQKILLQRQMALLKNLPTIDAYLYYGWDANPPLTRDNNGWQAMLNFRLPLWHWGAQKKEYQIAGLHREQIKQLQTKVRKQILRQVVNAYHQAQLQQDQIAAMAESKSEAAEAAKMAQIGYREGSLTNLELINTQKLLTRSQIEYLAAWYNFYIAKATLLRRVGLLEENLQWIGD